MKTRKPFGSDLRCTVAIWNPFGLGDLPYPVAKLNILIAILAPGEDPHLYLIVATQLKFLK